ncbi:ABC transporter ATP-binding protein (plasmid) [Cereibacter sphaeroides]|uniref:energy-coupling factor ABC transporter ATP-binding protein n=1 Tax=Cereibacter sphaeroides TaxID=1063 RepID=UPI000F526A0C|nr:ABC transporter ATP-binding protein [Cereibacter sphaeroides]AZB57974.1 ABC transporter ATP-binding protein [Cereibacter sphaeroides]
MHPAAGDGPPAPPAATRIEIAGVSHGFGEIEVLRGIDLTLTERRVAVVGANGSGKSTFARLLNGLLVPQRGQVRIDGLETARNLKTVRRKVGFVFQNPDTQIVLPTVEEDVAFGLKGLALSPSERAAAVGRILARYGLAELRERPAHRLSGGQKQLLALAGVLVTEPDCIVFDEPTTLLDLRNARRVAEAIRDLSQTAVVVTHDLSLVAGFDRALVFDRGRIVADDVPSRALADYVRRMQ